MHKWVYRSLSHKEMHNTSKQIQGRQSYPNTWYCPLRRLRRPGACSWPGPAPQSTDPCYSALFQPPHCLHGLLSSAGVGGDWRLGTTQCNIPPWWKTLNGSDFKNKTKNNNNKKNHDSRCCYGKAGHVHVFLFFWRRRLKCVFCVQILCNVHNRKMCLLYIHVPKRVNISLWPV